MTETQTFRILHCLRAPVGGLFRHVCDLAAAQSQLGHAVAVVCADTGDALTDQRLATLAAQLQLGVHRIAIARNIGLGDAQATRHVLSLARSLKVDVLHGHGAKGGVYARLAGRARRSDTTGCHTFYTPHGGSLHYPPTSLPGRVLMAAERRLESWTDGLIFESAYSTQRFTAQVGRPRVATRVIPNGVQADEFASVIVQADATQFVFVGELRHLKGVDVLLDALAMVNRRRRVTATIVGAGPDAGQFKAQATRLGLDDVVRFPGALPARDAFKMGHVLVMPSRAESFPYIVLEAGAAAVPLIATHVGGIPEITGDCDTPLIVPGDAEVLAAALFEALDGPGILAQRAITLQARIAEQFTVEGMTAAVLGFYADTAALTLAKSRIGRPGLAAH